MKTTFPPAIIAIGRNYAAHAAELNNKVLEHPIIFMKNPASVIRNGEPILIPPICSEGPEAEGGQVHQVDFEGELAVIIGRDAKDVSEANALEYVSGYAIANDVSARWWQYHGSGGQYGRGKSFDTFCPMSDHVAREKLADPQNLRLVTKVNGEVMQDSNTSDMIFSVARIVQECSRGTTLLAGTVILTGTPSGVGAGRKPPVYLHDGDVVEITIDGLGTLSNPVRSM